MINVELIVNVIIGVFIYYACISYLLTKVISAVFKSGEANTSKVIRKSFKERIEELEKQESETNQNKTK